MIKQLGLMALLVTLLNSCSNNVNDLNNQLKASTFTIAKVTSQRGEFKTDKSNYGLPVMNKINIKLCATQNGTNENIINEWFEIQVGVNHYTRRTNISGCLYLNHYEQFNFSSKEHFSLRRIVITGAGAYKGKSEIQIAINPWDKGAGSLKDLRYEFVNNEQFEKNAYALKLDNKSNLSLENFNLKLVPSNIGINRDVKKFVYSLTATPYLLRADLNNVLLKTSINQGKLNFSLKLIEHKDNGESKVISETSSELSIIRGKISGKVFFNINKKSIPDSMSNVELLVDITANNQKILNNLVGTYDMKGLNSNKTFEIRMLENVNDYLENLGSNNKVFNHIISDSSIFVSSIDLTDKGNDSSTLKLTNALDLTLSRRYQVRFQPVLKTYNSTTLNYDLIKMQPGKYILEAFIINPYYTNYDINNLEISSLNILSKTKKEVSLKFDGSINSILSFDFDMIALKTLAFENLLLLKVSSTDGTYQSPLIARAINFGNTNIQKYTSNTEVQIEELYAKSAMIEKEVSKAITIKDYKRSNPTIAFVGDYQQYSKRLKKINTESVFNSVSKHNLKMMSRKKIKTYSILIGKFCKEFYTRKGEIKACQRDPKKHILRENKYFIKDINEISSNGSNAISIHSETGDLFQGDAYFALYGSRSSSNNGTRFSEATTFGVGASGGVWANGKTLGIPLFASVDVSYKHTWTDEQYNSENMADMYASFDRNYIQKQTLKLAYDKITLQFNAKVKLCVGLSDLKNSKRILICDKEYKDKTMYESWHFVGRVDQGKRGILTGAEMQDLAIFNQIIRGENNFKRFQKVLSNKSAMLAIGNIGEVKKTNALYKIAKKNDTIYSNNSLPGMID